MKQPKTEQLIPYQFKPGQSGNPGGRPRLKAVTDPLKETLGSPIPERMMAALKQPVRELLIELFGENPTFGEMIAVKLIQSSSKGDMFATNTLLDRAEGRVTQKTELAGADGESLVFTIRRVDQE